VERRPGIPFLSSPKDERQWNWPVNEGQRRRPLELGGAALGVRGRGNGGGKQARWMKGSIKMPFIGFKREGRWWPVMGDIEADRFGSRRGEDGAGCHLMEGKIEETSW
jgi:hypothetical protein